MKKVVKIANLASVGFRCTSPTYDYEYILNQGNDIDETRIIYNIKLDKFFFISLKKDGNRETDQTNVFNNISELYENAKNDYRVIKNYLGILGVRLP